MKKNYNSGITIIALVITVILLLILAGIGISMISGDNGILAKTSIAKENTESAQIKERLQSVYQGVLISHQTDYTKSILEDALKKEFGSDYSVDDSNSSNWILSAKGESISIQAGESTRIKYTISFHPNGGIGTISNQTIYSNEEIQLTPNSFTKAGYIFTGWNTKEDGSGNKYSDRQSFSSTENIDLYAQWRKQIIATFSKGQDVNKKMKQKSGNANSTYSTTNTNIILIKKSSAIPDGYDTDDNNVALSDSEPIYIWFNNGTIYYYSAADLLYLNKDSSYMFNNLTGVKEIDIKFRTDNVIKMLQMFYNCNSLETLDLSTFNTANVTDMASMFGNLRALKNLDLGSFDTKKVTTMSNMFNGSTGIRFLNISSFDTRSLTKMSRMFSSMNNLKELDISSFDTSNVTSMEKMFDNMSSLTTIYASDTFVTTKVTNASNYEKMFNNDTQLVGGNGTTYDASHIDKYYAVIDSPPSTPGYFSDISEKAN